MGSGAQGAIGREGHLSHHTPVPAEKACCPLRVFLSSRVGVDTVPVSRPLPARERVPPRGTPSLTQGRPSALCCLPDAATGHREAGGRRWGKSLGAPATVPARFREQQETPASRALGALCASGPGPGPEW